MLNFSTNGTHRFESYSFRRKERPKKLKRKSVRLVNEGLRVRVSYSAERADRSVTGSAYNLGLYSGGSSPPDPREEQTRKAGFEPTRSTLKAEILTN